MRCRATRVISMHPACPRVQSHREPIVIPDLLTPRETLPDVQDWEWPIARHRLLKMGGQLGRDEWLRLVNRLLIDVKFRSVGRGSSTTSDAIFSVFYCWYMSHWKCSRSVIFQDNCMKQKTKRRKNSAVSYTVDNSFFLFLRLSHLSLGRLTFVLQRWLNKNCE